MSAAPKVSRYAYPPSESKLPNEERYKLARAVGEECQVEDELKKIIESNPSPVAYDGFEPSGRMHIAQGVMKRINVDRLTSAGFTYIFWVADWFAYLNHKMDGDLKKIQTVGRYFIEVWKALGMNMDRVKFLWASEEIQNRGDEYWGLVLEISTKFSLTRVKRCSTIMGRSDTGLSSSQILYPCMQTADIFFMEVDVCQLGVDQRKVNMLAREYAAKNKSRKRPVILSHHMLLGLRYGQDKMSKSDPDSAIFMEDTKEDIERKIKNIAYCPPKEVYESITTIINPCLDYFKFIFPALGKVEIKGKEGDLSFDKYEDLETAYNAGKILPETLKEKLIVSVESIIKPAREQILALHNTLKTVPGKTVFYEGAISLRKNSEKSGKSDIEGTIFVEDSEEEIKKKITDAYCPPKGSFTKAKIINPCMDYFKNLVFPSFPEVEIQREEKYGGNVSYKDYPTFEKEYIEGKLFPTDVKTNLSRYLNLLVQPVRDHFINDPDAKKLLEQVKSFKTTR